MPVARLLEETLGAPVFMIPMGQVRCGGVKCGDVRGEGVGSSVSRVHTLGLSLPHTLSHTHCLSHTLPLCCAAQASDAPHLENERIRRTNLFKGRNVIRRLLVEMAESMHAAAAAAALAACEEASRAGSLSGAAAATTP